MDNLQVLYCYNQLKQHVSSLRYIREFNIKIFGHFILNLILAFVTGDLRALRYYAKIGEAVVR